MRSIPRLFQLAGLVLLPLAMVAQMLNRITEGQLLMFLVAGICLFYIGYLTGGSGTNS